MGNVTHIDGRQWRDRVGGEEKALEERLAALRQRHRLAIHCFHFHTYPEFTHAQLRNNSKYLTPETKEVNKNKVAMLSMTLLPSQSAQAVEPFQVSLFGDMLAYLFDLDTQKEVPARVVRAFDGNGNTGKLAFSKKLRLHEKLGIPALDEFYKDYNKFHLLDAERKNENALLQAIWDHPELSGYQLDALGRVIDARRGTQLTEFNELIVAPTTDHIAAIAIPTLSERGRVAQEVEKLKGALSGFEHAHNGLDIPVVVYHVTGPNEGESTYFAQGKEECRRAALQAIARLQQNPNFRYIKERLDPENDQIHRMIDADSHPDLKRHYMQRSNREIIERVEDHTKRLLDVTLFTPLAEQGIKVGRETLGISS